MVKAVERAHAIGVQALQIFSRQPDGLAAARRTAGRAGRVPRAARPRIDIRPTAIHAAYLVNLAGPGDDFFGRSVAMLAHELRGAPSFGARYVNVHIGSHLDTGVAAGARRIG